MCVVVLRCAVHFGKQFPTFYDTQSVERETVDRDGHPREEREMGVGRGGSAIIERDKPSNQHGVESKKPA